MQMKEIKIEDLDHDTAFKVRLEIALLENACTGYEELIISILHIICIQ